ncbi:MAG TPA: class I SAM-dependent methyltransferase [Solirubrobacterales bacterium]|jgi:SAM-dependent methyltransferase|nr:class I SAM-dependent methyltransferase [Solirubrobacterales bacterium]
MEACLSSSPSHALLQSDEEWDVRNRVLSETLTELVRTEAPEGAQKALDIGCQNGWTTDRYAKLTGLEWVGIDPALKEEQRSPDGIALHPGFSNKLDFPDDSFDVVMLANVYEHILPEDRVASFHEMRRVLRPEGIVVGQIPNPYFPIESHSRLPFMGWLPIRAQKIYWKLSPVSWEHDFFVVTPKHLRRDAAAGGLRLAMVRKFNYPPEVIPKRVRGVARAMERPMRVMPWAWQFVLRPS